MITQTGEVANRCISWAARLLVDHHGARAPLMAARCAEDMERQGRDDLAGAWHSVRRTALLMVLPAGGDVTVH